MTDKRKIKGTYIAEITVYEGGPTDTSTLLDKMTEQPDEEPKRLTNGEIEAAIVDGIMQHTRLEARASVKATHQ